VGLVVYSNSGLGGWVGVIFRGWVFSRVLALVLWAVAVLWVWLPRAGDVAEFLAGEARLGRLQGGELDRLLGLAGAAVEVEGLFFGDGDGDSVCLGFYVVRVGRVYRVFVVVGYHSSSGLFIEAIDVEEWVSVARAKRLARLG